LWCQGVSPFIYFGESECAFNENNLAICGTKTVHATRVFFVSRTTHATFSGWEFLKQKEPVGGWKDPRGEKLRAGEKREEIVPTRTVSTLSLAGLFSPQTTMISPTISLPAPSSSFQLFPTSA